jgi:hypothetical protein
LPFTGKCRSRLRRKSPWKPLKIKNQPRKNLKNIEQQQGLKTGRKCCSSNL